MKKIMITQNSDAWLDWRKQGIGASEIAAIMGIFQYKSAADIYDEKKGLSETYLNSAMQRGKDFEGEARDVFRWWYRKNVSNVHGDKDFFEPLCVEHEDNSVFRASLDGWYGFNKSIVEIKVPNHKVMEMARIGEIPTHYIYQVQWQMFVSEACVAYYACYNPDTFEINVVKVHQDKELIDKMEKAALQFWDDFTNDRKPASKKDTYFLFDDKEQARLDNLAMLKDQIKKLEAQYKEEQKALIKDTGDECSLENDNVILYRGERSNIDYKKACEDAKLSLEAYKKPKTLSWTIKRKKND